MAAAMLGLIRIPVALVYLGILFLDVRGLPTTIPQVKCIPEHFYEEVAMTNHLCTICFTKEGRSQFERQCKSICRCTGTIIQSYVRAFYIIS